MTNDISLLDKDKDTLPCISAAFLNPKVSRSLPEYVRVYPSCQYLLRVSSVAAYVNIRKVCRATVHGDCCPSEIYTWPNFVEHAPVTVSACRAVGEQRTHC